MSSRLTSRVRRLEQQTTRRRGQGRCAACRDWPPSRTRITEIACDGTVTRQDTSEEPTDCPVCGWSPLLYLVEIEEVADWNSVGKSGRW
jgi:hypothetical protein